MAAARALEATVEIPATPEAVFDLVHDYPRRLEWDPLLREARLLDGSREAGLGVRALCRARLLAGGGAMETVYVSYRRPAVAAVVMTRGPRYIGRFAASIREWRLPGGATRLTYRFYVTGRPRRLRPVLDPLLARLFQRETKRRLAALRSHFQRSTIPGAPSSG